MTAWLTRHVQSALFAAGRLVRSPLSTGFTVLVIAIALTLPTALGLAIVSVRSAMGNFATAVEISVYFKLDVPLEKARQLAGSLRQRSGVASVQLFTADEARASFREDGFGPTLDALEENPFPHALYVRPDVTAKNNAPTRLTFLAAKGGYRYLVIRVTSGRKEQQLATLGHEMQHAVVIADAASVVDSQSLKREFERVGKLTQPSIGDDFFFESPVAEEVRRRILSEVTSQAGKASATK